MTPKETSKSMEVLAKTGVTAEEASAGMDRISKVLYEITVEEIKALATRRGIIFEEAEKIYLGRLDAMSGKKGRLSQWRTLRKVRKFGGFDY